MPKLPSVRDLGGIGSVSGARPVASADTSALAAGAAALGKGIQQFGAGLGEFASDQARYEYSQANADLLTKKIELDQRYDTDTDYVTRAERYTQDLAKLHEEAAARISSPFMRERFVTHSQPDIAKWTAGQQDVARKQEHEAQFGYVLEQGDKFIEQGTGSRDPDTRRQVVSRYGALVDDLAGRGVITPARARELKNDWAHRFAATDLRRRADSDPEAVINELRAAPGSEGAILDRIILNEGSGKNPRSSATGTGQFIDSTWLDVVKRNRPDLAAGRSDQELLALRADRALGREMTEAYRRENVASLTAAGVAEPTPGQQYLAHFLGPAAAAAVIKANPNTPVADVLRQAVGDKQAQKMIDANPEVLRGQLAGSVSAWSDRKMGGASQGSGSLYSMLRPDTREEILARAQTALGKREVDDLADFKQRVADTQAEAARTGSVSNPLSEGEFIGRLGAKDGPAAYRAYRANLELGRDAARVAQLSPDELNALLQSYEPKPGEGYADQVKRADALSRAVQQVEAEKRKDPAAFAIARLPAVQEAYAAFTAATSDPTTSPAVRQAAARALATKMDIEQARVGVAPADRRLLPKSYSEQFNRALAKPQASGGTANVVAAIENEAQLWGEHWPRVYQELAKDAQPVVRVIGSGVKAPAAQLLVELEKVPLGEILKDQDVERHAAVKAEVLTAFKPLAATMAGNEGAVRVFNDFRQQGEKLSAYYVMQGMAASDAAAKAFDDLVGHKYDFSAGTYRVPKDIPFAPALIASGVAAAKNGMGDLNIAPARDTMGGLSADYLKTATARAYARDGVWVTAPDESGLALIYQDRAVRRADGKPLVLTWQQLADLGRQYERDVATAAFGGAMMP